MALTVNGGQALAQSNAAEEVAAGVLVPPVLDVAEGDADGEGVPTSPVAGKQVGCPFTSRRNTYSVMPLLSVRIRPYFEL